MTTQSPIIPDDITTELASLEQAVSGLLDPNNFAEIIADELNYLGNEGAEPASLDAIHSNAVALTETAHQLNRAFTGALSLARAVQQQRETARQALDQLKRAVKLGDTDVPEVAELAETLEEIIIDEMDLWEYTNDYMIDLIWNNSPLEYYEAASLIQVLTGEGPSTGDPLWEELKDWLNRAEGCPTPATAVTDEEQHS